MTRTLGRQIYGVVARVVLATLLLQQILVAVPVARAAAPPPATQTPATGTPQASPSPSPTADPSTAPSASPSPSPSPSPSANPAPPTPAGPTVSILVKFKPTASRADKDAAVRAGGGQSMREFAQIRTQVVNVPAAARDQILAALNRNPVVERAAPTVSMGKASAPNDPGYPQQWALPKIGWDQAYGAVAVNGSANIAVLDTGVDASHPDLAGRVVGGYSSLNGVTTGDPTRDPNGHGTALAGIAAADVNNATGMAGVAYAGVSIMPVQVLGADGTGQDSDIVAGVLWAADNGANVILMGFSSPDYSAALADALNYAWGKGAVLVAATGNDGSAAASYPAGMPNVLGVAATDQNDALTSFSNTGSATVAAPGAGIYATQPGGGYGTVSGTSAAAAEAAGLAALLVASGKSNSDVANQSRGAVDPVAGRSFGRIDVAKALGAPVAPAPAPTPSPAPSPSATPVYTAAENIALNPASGSAGTTVTVNGSGWNTPNNITITFGGSPVAATPSPCRADSNNAFSCSFVVPSSKAPGNYTVQASDGFTKQASATFTITTKQATSLTVSAATGTYGGTTTLTATLTAGGSGVNGETIAFTLNGNAVGTATTNSSGVATLSNVSLVGINAGTYATGVAASFAGASAYNASSGANSLTVSKAAPAITWSNPAGITYGTALGSTQLNATANVPGSFAYTPAAGMVLGAGSGQTLSVSFTPTDTSNYNGASASVKINVAQASLTVTADNKTKTYGDANPAFTVSYSGFVNGDTAASLGGTLSFATTATASSPVGMYDVTPSGLTAANYAITFVKGTLTVIAKPVTGGFTAAAKVYDGTTSATITGTSLAGVVGTDDVRLSGGTATFADRNVGAGKIVTGTGFGLSGAAAGNYAIAAVNPTTASITAKPLTISGAVAQDKAYDGTTAAIVNFANASLVGVVGGDAVSIDSSSDKATFADKAVGQNKPVTVTGVALGGAAAGNYTVAQPSGLTANITARGVTVSGVAANDKVYDSTAAATLNTSGATLNGVAPGDQVTLVTSAASGSFADKTVGTGKPVTVTGLSLAGSDAANYAISAGNTPTASITAKGLTVSFTAAAKVYDGTTSATITGTSLAGVVDGDKVAADATAATASFDNKNVGASKTVTGSGFGLSGVDAANYTIAAVNPATASITARALTVTADAKSKVYGDADPDLTYQITAGGLVASDSLSGALTRVPGEDVGVYAIQQGTLTAGGNYALTFAGADLTIGQRAVTITPAGGQGKVYGESDPALAFTNDAGLIPDAFTGALARDPGEAVGQYTIRLGNLSAGGNYSLALASTPVNFAITARAVTVTADAKSKTYGDADPALTYKVTGGSLVAGDGFTGSLARDAGEAVGAYNITQGTLALSPNYALTFVGAQLTVAARPVTVTADPQTKVYGDPDPAPLTYKVTGGSLAFSDTFTGALARDAGENVGDYAITQGTLALNANYALTFTPGTLTIGPRVVEVTADAKGKVYGEVDPALTYQITAGSLAFNDAFSGSLARDAGEAVGSYAITQGTLALNANYALSFVGAKLTISQRAVTVTADPQTKVYGADDPVLTYSITAGSLVTGDAFSGVLTRASGENVGSYAIQQGTLALSGNYALTFVGANLAITKAPLTVTAKDATRLYGAANPDFTGTLTGVVNGDNFIASYSTAATETAGVGNYAIVPALADPDGKLGNYDVTATNGTLTVTPAPLTIAAKDATKVYGQANPAFTVTYDGFVNGDDATTLAGTLAFDTAATASSPVGSYDVTPKGLTATNYTISFVKGTLTVTPAPLTVTADNATRTYGDANPTFTGSVTGIQNGDNITASYSTTAAATSPVGDYAITVTLSDPDNKLGNYDVTLNAGTLTITKAPLTITADSKTKTYGDANPELTGQIVGIKNGDGIAATYSTSADVASPVGTYAIVPAPVDSAPGTLGNYDVTLNNGTLAVTKATSTTVLTVPTSAVYDGTAKVATAQVSGAGGLSQAVAVTYYLKGSTQPLPDAPVAVGDYTASAAYAGDDNHTGSADSKDFSIAPRPVTVTAGPQTKVYGDADPALTYKVTSGNLVGQDAFTGALARAAGEDVGDYAITQGNLALSNNYALTFVGANLTIGQRVVVVTAAAKPKVYGTADPALTFTITQGSLAFNDAFTGTLTRDAGEDAGTYAIGRGTLALSPNYALSFVGANLTITPAPLTVTANDATKTYGDASATAPLGGTIAGIKNDDPIAATYASAEASDATTKVGTYAGSIVPTLSDGGIGKLANYSVTVVKGTLTVTPAPLTVTANPATKVYGAPNPAFGVTYTGFVPGQGVSALGGTLTFSTAAATSSDAGNYAVTPGGLISSNYAITFKPGTLTITKAPLTVTANPNSKVYGLTSPTAPFSGTITGVKNNDLIAATYASAEASNAATPVGTYPNSIVPTLSDNGTGKLANYTVTSHSGTLTVDQAPLTVSIAGPQSGAVYAAGTSVPFGGNFTFTGPASTFTVTWTFTSNASAPVALTTTSAVGTGSPGKADVGYSFAAAGVYYVKLAVTDNGGNYAASTATQVMSGGQLVDAYVVIYDPSAGFVTGGGWINSPAGACKGDPSLPGVCVNDQGGRANFGFVAKYQNGAKTPTGQTEFQFKDGNLNFHSDTYQWLVVSGAQAQYKGTGSINGAGNYGFMLTMTDGDLLGTGKPDLFRIKIWVINSDGTAGNVIYDNMYGSSDSMGNGQAIAGGSIQIKTK